MRLAVYTDYVYRRVGSRIYAERAFALFLASLAPHVDRLVLIGRLSPDRTPGLYLMPEGTALAPLTHYDSLANPFVALIALARSVGQLWRSLDQVDVVWVLGPYIHAMVLVVLARMRRRRVILGVRQDWPTYVRTRHPNRRPLHLLADLMEFAWRSLARVIPTVCVGAELAAHYRRSPAVLDITVSLVPESALAETVPEREPSGAVRVLSVGRLEEEKNPLLLVEILARLRDEAPGWRLCVVGTGPLAPALAARAEELGVADALELRGYVPMGPELMGLYRESDLFLHVSWTEGFPQVLVEAMAAGLPAVATAVGGVRDGVGDAALLIGPGEADTAAAALVRLAGDPDLRRELAMRGRARAGSLTLEAQISRLAAFLARPEAVDSTGVGRPAGDSWG